MTTNINQYYCPYCQSRYQFHKQRSDGVMICGQCGDPLVKKNAINTTQTFAILTAIAFISPFILIVVASLENLNRQRPQRFNESMTMNAKVIKFGYLPLRSNHPY